ncbi:hypothetical protein PIB30_099178, partial [Stylosanthes scabra]|nr:hypothetical protein [Stylosanthes scabra]
PPPSPFSPTQPPFSLLRSTPLPAVRFTQPQSVKLYHHCRLAIVFLFSSPSPSDLASGGSSSPLDLRLRFSLSPPNLTCCLLQFCVLLLLMVFIPCCKLMEERVSVPISASFIHITICDVPLSCRASYSPPMSTNR